MVTLDTKQFDNWIDRLSEDKNIQQIKRLTEVISSDAEPEVGQTPKEVIWTKNKSKLYRYQPAIKKTNKVPILMIYALINKPYILDLYPGNSLIEHLTNKGHDVYLLDWGTPGYEDRNMKLDDYIVDYIPRAVSKVLKTSKAKDITLLGYCMGGTMTAIFTALYPQLPIRNLILMTSPIDFKDAGHYSNWLDKRYFQLDKLVDTLGNIPFELIDFGNKLLNPISNVVGPYISLADRVENEDFVLNWKLMQKWLNDGIPFPGESYRQWIRDFYQDNKLINDQLSVRGRKVELANIKANLLNISATRDNIALPQQIAPLNDKVSSKNKTLHIVETGHVSVVTGRKAINEIHPYIEKWITDNSK
ncbi:class III poly(R)-hydroxyalkanoic acid synthase subunit PhaC [Psychrobacillus lasiicapitis]|uniref:Poly(3-hydroxyalkanoate) polymerase subunit PhaC n=1 Tax=Psychrobacillus lasiicapitis TaxID=1636719 RepID=A0A544T1Z4_9BACI|nr:class III poly(R)-hydroxyalkanoic acid synthase subunit PhaC [Psychrobacillus lasiicapitis]TQR11469.1 class III poly(R)-hydroxyalkanoic acid synthase subunit PhaC [Psychrobacillus lasiicapitis]GGA40275.1 class III poly(R)-hydroxyalkanoic acid synthase subunit PhaC [Psychrobacillus lasiicapitis]